MGNAAPERDYDREPDDVYDHDRPIGATYSTYSKDPNFGRIPREDYSPQLSRGDWPSPPPMPRMEPSAREVIRPSRQWDAPDFTPMLRARGPLECPRESMVDYSQPRGIRNKNPGNLRANAANQWVGKQASTTEKTFEVFDTAQNGLRAMAKTLNNYQSKHNLKTPAQIASRYAPSSDGNNTTRYAEVIADAAGVKTNETVDLTNESTMKDVMKAMVIHENGNPSDGSTNYYTDATYTNAIRDAK